MKKRKKEAETHGMLMRYLRINSHYNNRQDDEQPSLKFKSIYYMVDFLRKSYKIFGEIAVKLFWGVNLY